MRSVENGNGNGDRPFSDVGEVKLGALVIFGIVGAAIGACAAWVIGYGIPGLILGYVGGGATGVLAAAMLILVYSRIGNLNGNDTLGAPIQRSGLDR